MANYTATIKWQRNGAPFTDNKYSRGHTWHFDGGIQVPASSSPHVVPLPLSVENAVDPEEALVASLSSCHMLFFVALCAKRGFVVDSYVDEAIGTMEKNAEGVIAMTRVVLRPLVKFSGTELPTAADLEKIHHQSHKLCYIANSVKSEVLIEPRSEE